MLSSILIPPITQYFDLHRWRGYTSSLLGVFGLQCLENSILSVQSFGNNFFFGDGPINKAHPNPKKEKSFELWMHSQIINKYHIICHIT